MPKKENNDNNNVVENNTTPVNAEVETNEPPDLENEELRTDPVIEIPWEKAESIFETKRSLVELEDYFSSMLLSFEKRKVQILNDISTLERNLYFSAEQLRENMNIDSGLTYELKIPDSPQEKAYFLRKDDQ